MVTVEQRDLHRNHLDPPTASVSGNGRHVAFTTSSRLAPADLDGSRDVYVLHLAEHRVSLESLALETGLYGDSSHPAISGDARFVAYEIAGQIVLRDRHGSTSRVLGEGRQPSVSADGGAVVFTSDSSRRISIWDAQTNAVSSIGEPLPSITPTISSDGRYVAFAGKNAIFVHDRKSHTTEKIAAGWDPAISAAGQHVAYVAKPGNVANVFVFDRETRKIQLVSRTSRGRPANGASANPAISGDGNIVAFQSEAANLVEREDFNLLWDVFRFDRERGMMIQVSGAPGAGWLEPSGGPAVDGSGSVVAFSSRHPTGSADAKNDFDLFVATYAADLNTETQRHRERP